MEVIADLQLHSRYARAVSKDMNVATIAAWAAKKGIDLVATGDWTHPVWLSELKSSLSEVATGVYGYKDSPTKFLLATEISSIYSQNGKTHRVHTLVWAPDFGVVEKINRELTRLGCNLLSDGRPIVGLSCQRLADVVLNVDPNCFLIPAHSWTPWFSVFGSSGGFDSLAEAYGEYESQIYAVETGLSSDPAMNWRVDQLDNKAIVSFSDAHSAIKLGREATVFTLPQTSYPKVREAIINHRISHTIEFYPEEGKYHYNGHARCQVALTPQETRKMKGICPKCGRPLTIGVMQRVEELATRPEVEIRAETDKLGVVWCKHPQNARPPYVCLVPLNEILAEVYGVGVGSKQVSLGYENLISRFGSEFKVLLKVPLTEITQLAGERTAEAIGKVRKRDIVIKPGYDGVYGIVKVWPEGEEDNIEVSQQSLF